MRGAKDAGMSAASATPARSRRSSGSRPARSAGRGIARVRWDRLARIAMLLVLISLVFLYLDTGLHMLSTWRESHRASARVGRLEAEHRELTGERNRLSSQSDLEQQARALGMQRPGEQPYVVTHLPRD